MFVTYRAKSSSARFVSDWFATGLVAKRRLLTNDAFGEAHERGAENKKSNDQR